MKEREIFAEALERESGRQRDSYLAGACAGDDALRAAVERLLIEHLAEAPSLLDAPAAPPTSAVGADGSAESPGDWIGRYRLLEVIGEGGFGVVWMAEQREPVRRKVALKIIKAGMDTKQVIARFEAERQALAIMDHANIAKVLDGGATDRGRPYFVMELVRGVPITDFCDQARLDTTGRLQLFQDVCHAVQHAHQKGVIHRDIKPSNVLVTQIDGRATPKVIDFGIAKATGAELTQKTVFTEFHQFIGTPEYMSPEQAVHSGIDVDTRADVYSLGVLLYELLTGTKPFDLKAALNQGWDEMLRVICEQEPPRPSTRVSTLGSEGTRIGEGRHSTPRMLGRLFRDDLDWIVLRALEKERDRRYESAAGLALDIERFLTNEPVLATPPSRVYRLRKAYRRNRKSFVSAGLLLLALIAGVVGTSLSLARALEAEALARARLTESLLAQRDAALARDESESVVRFLSDMLAAANPSEIGREVRVREVLDVAAARIESEFAGRPLIEARLRDTLANTYEALGLPAEAQVEAKRALMLRKREQGEAHPHTLRSGMLDAVIQSQLGHLAQSEELLNAVLAAQRAEQGDDAPDTLATRAHRAGVLTELGRWSEAELELREVLAAQTRSLGEADRRTLATRMHLARVLCHESRFDEAQPLYQATLEAQRRTLGAQHPDTLATAHEFGVLMVREERFTDAAPLLEQTVREHTEVLGAEHPLTLTARVDLAEARVGLQRLDEARTELEQVIEIRRRVSGPQHPDTLAALGTLGLVERDEGQLEDAARLLGEALAAQREARGLDHPRVVILLLQLAETVQRQDLLSRAQELIEDGLPIARRVLGPDHLWTLKGLWTLGGIYRRLGRFADAERVLVDLLERRRRVFGEESPATTHALGNLFVLRLDEGRLDEAEALCRECIDRWRRHEGEDDARLYSWQRALGVLVTDRGQLEEAALLLKSAYEGLRRVSGEEASETLQALSGLGELQRLQGDDASAVELWRRAFDIRVRTLGIHHTDAVGVASRLGEAYVRLGNVEAARALALEVLSTPPEGPAAMNVVSWYLLTCQPQDMQDPERALALAAEANDLADRRSPHILDTLASAFHRIGRLPEAIAAQRRALELSPRSSRARYEQRLRGYEDELARK